MDVEEKMSVLRDEVNKIIGRMQKGNKHAFNDLYVLTYHHLKLVAYNYLSDSSLLEDALNEAYMKIYRYMQSADFSQDGYNWMCKIVQNICYDFNRTQQVYEPIDRMGIQKLFYEIDESILTNSSLVKIIQTFETINQELLYMHFWEDLTFEEIANRKGMKKSTVYKRIKTMMKKIHKEIKFR